MKALILAAALGVLACYPPIEPAFSGTYNGTVVLTLYGTTSTIATSSNKGRLVIDVFAEHYGTAKGICPGGGGEVDFTGSGREGEWSGLLSCPFPTTDCSSSTLIYRTGKMTLEPGPRLRATVNGEAALCPGVYTAKVEFDGLR